MGTPAAEKYPVAGRDPAIHVFFLRDELGARERHGCAGQARARGLFYHSYQASEKTYRVSKIPKCLQVLDFILAVN
jgi:hypothetical protein